MERRTKLPTSFAIAIVTFGLTIFPSFSMGEEDDPQEALIAPGDIAIIDMARVFKEYVAFNGAMERMKREIDEFEMEIRAQKDEIVKRAADAKTLLEGSEEREAIEAEVLKATSDLKVEMEVKRKSLLAREGRLYAATYDEVTAEVQRYARKLGIRIVLRFDTAPIDPEDRDSVLKGVNRSVVFFEDNLDITDPVLDRLNGKTAAVERRDTRRPNDR